MFGVYILFNSPSPSPGPGPAPAYSQGGFMIEQC